MRELLQEASVEMLVLVRHDYLDDKLYFSFDAENKKEIHHMIKHTNVYETKKDKLITYELDSDSCAGTNQKTIEAIGMIMMKLDPSNTVENNRIMCGLSTDAGVSGTGDEFEKDLRVLGRLSPILIFLGVTYFFRRYSLDFTSPVEKHFMLGGVKRALYANYYELCAHLKMNSDCKT